MKWRPKFLWSVWLWLCASLISFTLTPSTIARVPGSLNTTQRGVRVYLNPNTGRFWTMDSYAGNNQDPLSLHKYLYCHANPVNGIDPSGHDTLVNVLSAGGIMGTLAAIRTYIKSDGEASWGDLGSSFAQGFVIGAGLGYAVPWLWGAGVYGRAVVGAGVAVTSALGVGQVVEDIGDEQYDLAVFDGVLTAGGLYGLSAMPFRNYPKMLRERRH